MVFYERVFGLLIKSIKWSMKFILSGLLVFLIFCGFSFLFYNTGRHSVNPNGATDYVWEGNKFYCQFREGFGFGVTDDDGFNNAFPGVTSDSDILIMGSSHMEAVNVKQSEATAYLLNEYLGEYGSPLTAYNIGASAHNYFKCIENLEDALIAYSPEIVVIETYLSPVNESYSQMVLNGTLQEVTSYEGILYDIQAVPLPKLLMQQYREYQSGRGLISDTGGFANFKEILSSCNNGQKNNEGSNPIVHSIPTLDYTMQLTEYIKSLAEKYDVQIIIVFHPILELRDDGSAEALYNKDLSNMFYQICADNGITYIDMGDVFLDNYKKHHILPHGFYNTKIGTGHLNSHGHKMIAKELFRVILELQGEYS